MEISTADGFGEITESSAEMIKYVANEPSVGLYYVQQHTQNAVPNVIALKNNLAEKSRDTALHTEDLEDSITVVRSMKDYGSTIADEMIKDIRESLTMMSVKHSRRGLMNAGKSGFQLGRTSSWGPGAWGRSSGEDESGYFSTIFKSARQKASDVSWMQLESKDRELDERSSLKVDELREGEKEDAREDVESPGNDVSASEDFDAFKANKEAEMKEWLGGT